MTDAWFSFWILCSALLVPDFRTMLYCPDYCGFVIHFETQKCDTSNLSFSLLVKTDLAIVALFVGSYICFRIPFSDSVMNFVVSIILPIREDKFSFPLCCFNLYFFHCIKYSVPFICWSYICCLEQYKYIFSTQQ